MARWSICISLSTSYTFCSSALDVPNFVSFCSPIITVSTTVSGKTSSLVAGTYPM